MKIIVPLHNNVNERTWHLIKQWESESSPCPPILVKFEGRPNDYTIQARMYQFFGFKLPFDRHDWIVDRCGHRVRYIIDYYHNRDGMFIDCRPAPTMEGLYQRIKRLWS